MYFKWIVLNLIFLNVEFIYSQQCLKLQNCMDLAIKTINEMQQQQYPVGSSSSIGSYNAISVHTGSAQCRSLRNQFECMINYSPYCLRNDMTRNSGQYISQAKQLLDMNCDQGTSWSNTQCYRKQEITQNCEPMISELSIGNYNYYSASIPKYVCEKYQRFRHCTHNILLTQCTPMERETFFSYLYDKVQEVSWKCANDSLFFDNYERYHPISQPLYNGMINNGMIAQPPYALNTYGNSYGGSNIGSGYANTNYYPSTGYGNRINYYDRNRYGNDYDRTRYINDYDRNRYGGGYGNLYGIEPTYDESICLEKTRYVARQCEDSLLQRQRDARNQRTSVDIQRRICCSIYFFRDCLANTVLKNCRENSPNVVEILMGEGRRRELSIGCREYSYDYCNSSFISSLNYLLILLISFIQLFKSNLQII